MGVRVCGHGGQRRSLGVGLVGLEKSSVIFDVPDACGAPSQGWTVAGTRSS